LALLVDTAEDMRREDVLVEAIRTSDLIEKLAAPCDALLIFRKAGVTRDNPDICKPSGTSKNHRESGVITTPRI
jgi:hypothetical protein